MIQDIWNNILVEFQNNEFLKGGVVVSAMMALWAYCRQIPGLLLELYHRYCTLSVEISQGSDMFMSVAQSIFDVHKDSQCGIFSASSKIIPSEQEFGVDFPGLYDDEFAPPLGTDNLMPFGVRYHRVGLCVARSEIVERKLENASPDQATTYQISLTLFGFGKKATISRIIESGRMQRLNKSLRVKTNERDYWQLGNLLPARHKHQIITTVTDELLEDLRIFRDSSRWYTSKGIPHRRGVLLYGPPGTGKSSLAQVIANELSMDLNVLNLSGITARSLQGLLAGSNKLVLIEDLDVACDAAENRKSSKSKDSKGIKLSLSDILNAIDGVSSGTGIILLVTTNDRESLDPALLRPGRIDKQYEIGYLTQETFDKLCLLYYGESCNFKLSCDSKLTAATVQGVFIENSSSIKDFEATLWKNHSQN